MKILAGLAVYCFGMAFTATIIASSVKHYDFGTKKNVLKFIASWFFWPVTLAWLVYKWWKNLPDE